MFQWRIKLLRLTFNVLFQAPDSFVALFGVPGGEDEGERLECRPRSNEFIDQSAAYGKAKAAVALSGQKRKTELLSSLPIGTSDQHIVVLLVVLWM